MKDIMEKIKVMVAEDCYRWYDANYCGLLIVHPDMVEDVTSMLCVDFERFVGGLHTNGNCNSVSLKGGGTLKVWHFEVCEDSERLGAHNFAGYQCTSVMLSLDMKGGYHCDLREVPSLGNGKVFDNMNYMVSRLRSNSLHSSKLVMM
jgi:hypothetical protein